MKKILIFSTTYLPLIGGAEMAVKEITDRIYDFQFDMITLRFNSRLPKFERVGNINVYRLGFSKENPTLTDLVKFPLILNKFFFPITACFKAISLHRKNKYFAIWSIMAAYAGFAAMFFKTSYPKVPYLLTLQEGDPIDYIKKKVFLVKPLFKKIFTKADFIQVISNYLSSFAREIGYQGDLAVIPNGVDIVNFSRPLSGQHIKRSDLGLNENNKVLITISRLVKKNAVDDIIQSLVYLPDEVKLLVLGDGPDKIKLIDLAKKLKLENRIIFIGQVAHPVLPEYLALADIFIRPSLSEGLGNSFLEAMAAGTPVIATPVGGIVDFLHNGETGLFSKVRDPKSIAAEVKKYIENKELTEKIKVNAKNLIIKNYNWSLIAEKINDIFTKLTN
jgi:glycosyltransferase involved in cell wall biosynthesis